jgi:hypothetical protein
MEMNTIKNKSRLDHLVIASYTLEQGVTYVAEKLGVTIPFGGKHTQMGTHNHLVALGNDSFLEIIAIDPDADSPQRPRWFDLDNPLLAQSLRKSPRLLSWVVNTRDIFRMMETCACSFGTPEKIHRNSLSWYFSLPSDGRLLGGGFLPYIIQWNEEKHPALQMTDSGIRLHALKALHQHPDWLRKMLSSIGSEEVIEIEKVSCSSEQVLLAEFDTPLGKQTLSSGV